MTQERIQKTTQTRKEKREEIAAEKESHHVDTEKLKADLDTLIDEIDAALSEAEAEALVSQYVQKGGE